MSSRETLRALAAELALARDTDIAEAERLCALFFDTIAAALARDGIVKIPSLGTFEATADGDVAFTPSAPFADAVNRPFSCFAPVALAPEAEPEEEPAEAPDAGANQSAAEVVVEERAEPEAPAAAEAATAAGAEPEAQTPVPPPYRPKEPAMPPPYRPRQEACAPQHITHQPTTAMPQLQETPGERRSSLLLSIIICLACIAIGFVIGLFW